MRLLLSAYYDSLVPFQLISTTRSRVAVGMRFNIDDITSGMPSIIINTHTTLGVKKERRKRLIDKTTIRNMKMNYEVEMYLT